MIKKKCNRSRNRGQLVFVGDLFDPVQIGGHLDVHSGHAGLAASHAPADDADQVPRTGALAHQRTAAVALQ